MIPVELLAVVVLVTVPAPWQRVPVAGENALIVTVGVTVSAAGGEEIICEHVPLGELMTTSKLPALAKVTPVMVNDVVVLPE